MPSGVPCGSVSHLLVCTRGGVVLHERLFAGQEEADTSRVVSLRAALWTIAQPLLHSAREEEEHVALHENLTVLWFAVSDLLVFVTGEGVVVDELSLSTVARGVLAALRNATGKPGLSCETLLDGHAFAKACVALDELLPQGVLETTDEETLHSGAKMKLPISK